MNGRNGRNGIKSLFENGKKGIENRCKNERRNIKTGRPRFDLIGLGG